VPCKAQILLGRLVKVKSRTWIMLRECHDSRRSFGFSNNLDMSRWFEKIPRQVCDKPAVSGVLI